MKNLIVGIFHDGELGKDLGKKGYETDIIMFNRKTDDYIFTFMQPAEGKLSAKSQIMSCIDFAIVSFTELTHDVGETVVMLDSFGISNGIILSPPYADTSQIEKIIKDTSLQSFVIIERDITKIFELLQKVDPKRVVDASPVVVIDQAFSVKGVGEILLGFVKKGIIKKHDKLSLIPANKEVIVRSIQMQDKNFDEAEAGSRVGLAIKGAAAEEMKRGFFICAPEDCEVSTKLTLSFEKNKFYPSELTEGLFHATVGMQTVPAKIANMKEKTITLELEKQIVYTKDDTFLLLDLNAKKLHVIGKGKVIKTS
ncbi:selenocysteine-specific translation elongation factor [Thermoplasmatales archaeon SCGC AB-539-N05]|nr:selenocysteine-specific translation elongation factor [Thermoplasmatales archaeon SCGC AB-539-N05]